MKTILLHVDDSADLEARLGVAFALAERHKAHLVAIHTLLPAEMPAAITGRGASAAYIAQAIEHNRATDQQRRARFEQRCRQQGVSAEWRAVEADPVDALRLHACYSDLVIATIHKPRTLEDRLVGHPIDQLPVVSAAPVLMLPVRAGVSEGFDRKILVAWKAEPPAARSLHAAIPMLRMADQVHLLAVAENDRDHLPGADIGAALARHGIKVTIHEHVDGADNQGVTILEHAASLGVGMVVMGAHGHSRLHDLVLGSTTRQMLRQTTLPLLLGH